MTTHWPEIPNVAVGEETQHVACDEKDCGALPTIHCEFPDGTDGGNYCQAHCSEAGFCYGCGQFWAGVERFDFAVHYGGIAGLCENCEEQVRSDMGENDDEDESERDA